MSNDSSEAMLRSAKRATFAAIAIFVVTTVHHVYGAYIYKTPWRVHAAFISGLATALIGASLWLFRRYSRGVIGAVASWAFIALTFLVPFFGFGVFEGAYNHGLKDALYFTYVSPRLIGHLFPPPAYEMPSDVFFETTGLMHIIPGLLTGFYLYRFMRERQKLRRTSAKPRAVRAA